jgi:nucleotide-binding universal stress UspA family protein
MYVLPDADVHPEIETLLSKYINKTLGKIEKAIKTEGISLLKTLILSGNPTDKILQVANDERANLILIGSGDESDKEEFRLGVTAEKLVRLSDIPVWVAKSNQEMELKRILCPVDFSNASKRALKNAILLSNNFQSSLTILGVYEPVTTTSPRIAIDLVETNNRLLKQFQNEMETFLAEFDLKGVNYNVEIDKGIPHEKILLAIDKLDCDLLVIGTNGRSGFSRIMLGSVTEKVIRNLPCSFVTTKTQDIFKLRFDNEIKEIETHFSNANRLVKSGLYNEAIGQYLICLQINDMHVPSMYKLSELYKILGNDEKVEYYDKMAKDLLQRLWDKKIENEIRKHYRSNI